MFLDLVNKIQKFFINLPINFLELNLKILFYFNYCIIFHLKKDIRQSPRIFPFSKRSLMFGVFTENMWNNKSREKSEPAKSNKDQKAVKRPLRFPSFFFFWLLSRVTKKKEMVGNSEYRNTEYRRCRNKASCGKKLLARLGPSVLSAGKKQFRDWSCGRFTNVRAVKNRCGSEGGRTTAKLKQDTCRGRQEWQKGSQTLKIIAVIIARTVAAPEAEESTSILASN